MLFYVAGFWLLLILLTTLAWLDRDRSDPWWCALGQPETGVATLLACAAVLTVVVRPAFATRFSDLAVGLATIDFALFVGLAVQAARSGRWWVMCAAALQLISATAHIARLSRPGMWRLGYQVMEEASSYPTLLLLAWAIWSHHRRATSAGRSVNC